MPKISKALNVYEESIANEIKNMFGSGMLTISEVQQFLGAKSVSTAKKWLADVDYRSINGKKRYLVSDIARKLEKCKNSYVTERRL